jgi:ethanolamine ammonia-lyase large subunit
MFGKTAIRPFHEWLVKKGFVDERGRLTQLAGDASVLF